MRARDSQSNRRLLCVRVYHVHVFAVLERSIVRLELVGSSLQTSLVLLSA